MKKLMLIAILLVIFAFVPVANGALLTVAEYPYGAADTNSLSSAYSITTVHPSASAETSGFYLTFQVTYNNTLLNSTSIYVAKTGSPVAYYRCSLYSTEGAYGSTAVPDVLIENSIVDYDQSAFPNGGMFNAQFSQTTPLYAGVTYALTVTEVNETTSSTSHFIKPYYDTIGSYGGNWGYYAAGAWSLTPSSDDDLCFSVYGEGGDIVAFSGGNIYVNQQVTNITSSPNVTVEGGTTEVNVGGVTAEFNNTAVSAGDVVASGGVTAAFNNTSISAGDVTAGDVAAGSVTASGEVTVEGGVNATLQMGEETTFNLNTTSDFIPWAIIVFIIINMLLVVFSKVPLLNFIVGVCGFGLAAYSFTQAVAFTPYVQILLFFTSLLVFAVGGFRMRSGS